MIEKNNFDMLVIMGPGQWLIILSRVLLWRFKNSHLRMVHTPRWPGNFLPNASVCWSWDKISAQDWLSAGQAGSPLPPGGPESAHEGTVSSPDDFKNILLLTWQVNQARRRKPSLRSHILQSLFITDRATIDTQKKKLAEHLGVRFRNANQNP